MEDKKKLSFVLKNVNAFQKVFEKMDGRCRQLCFANPKRPVTDYCQKCQKMFNDDLSKICGGD